MTRKPVDCPTFDPGLDAPQEPLEKDLEAGLEIVTSSAPMQHPVPDLFPENTPVLTASQTTSTAETTGVSQVGMPPSPPFSLFSSILASAYAGSKPGPSRQLQMEFSSLNLNSHPVDSLIVSVPFPSRVPSPSPVEPLVPCETLELVPSSAVPPYNLRSLANRHGKDIALGGLEQDLVPIGPRKLRGRKSNVSDAQHKAIMDIIDGKQKSMTRVLRATKLPPDILK